MTKWKTLNHTQSLRPML